jgi:hypothetical protein
MHEQAEENSSLLAQLVAKGRAMAEVVSGAEVVVAVARGTQLRRLRFLRLFAGWPSRFFTAGSWVAAVAVAVSVIQMVDVEAWRAIVCVFVSVTTTVSVEVEGAPATFSVFVSVTIMVSVVVVASLTVVVKLETEVSH